MAETIRVTTQDEMDAAIERQRTDSDVGIEVYGSAKVNAYGSARVNASDSAVVTASGNAVVNASGNAVVNASGSARVNASGSARVNASGSAVVTAYDRATVYAYGNAVVNASGNARVYAYGSARVNASGSAVVNAYGSARVYAYGSAKVYASGSARVYAYGNAVVNASGNAKVYAYGSARVYAYGSARVNASGSAVVYAYDRATVYASRFVTILRRSPRSRVSGGQVPDLSTPLGWCEYTGAVEASPGTWILYKGVDAEFRSVHGTVYLPGTEIVAPDWDGGAEECGGGLHFCAHPEATLQFVEAVKFVACEVALADMAAHEFPEYPNKIKARACRVLYECDVHGERITSEVA